MARRRRGGRDQPLPPAGALSCNGEQRQRRAVRTKRSRYAAFDKMIFIELRGFARAVLSSSNEAIDTFSPVNGSSPA